MYALYRAYLDTLPAAGTFSVINSGKVIHNGNSALRTSLLTLHTANAAIRALLARHSSLIVIGALDDNAYRIGHKMN